MKIKVMKSRCPEHLNFAIWGARVHPGIMWRRRRRQILLRTKTRFLPHHLGDAARVIAGFVEGIDLNCTLQGSSLSSQRSIKLHGVYAATIIALICTAPFVILNASGI
jgi:hypothetical protein